MVSPSRRKNPTRTIPIGFAFAPPSIRAITAVISRSHSNSPEPEIAAPTSSRTALCHPSFHHKIGATTTVTTASSRSARRIVRLKSSSLKLAISRINDPSSNTAKPSQRSAKTPPQPPAKSPQSPSSSDGSADPTTPQSATRSRTPPAAQSPAESSTPPSPARPAHPSRQTPSRSPLHIRHNQSITSRQPHLYPNHQNTRPRIAQIRTDKQNP